MKNKKNKIFNSIVNNVKLLSEKDSIFVRKIFLDEAKILAIPLMPERINIEKRVYELLEISSLDHEIARTARIINVGKDYIDFEFIDGTILGDMGDDIGKIPLNSWIGIGRWCRTVEIALFVNRNKIFDNFWACENYSKRIMNNLKSKSFFREGDTAMAFSLGDFGINNIIFKGSIFYPLDFEFAHVSFPGRDAGQLIASLQHEYETNVKHAVEGIRCGYFSEGGMVKDLELWIENFKNYYKDRKYENRI